MKSCLRFFTIFCLVLAAMTVSVFLLPVSRWMALTAFVLVLWIAWPRPDRDPKRATPDRFRDSERVARQILKSAGL